MTMQNGQLVATVSAPVRAPARFGSR
jgi:hypothetical protein